MRIIRFFVLAFLLIQNSFSGEDLILRGKEFGNFFPLSSPVVFTGSKEIAKDAVILGKIYNGQAKCVKEISVSGANFNREGWKWLPETPGFYEIEFFLAGKKLTEKYPLSVFTINQRTKKRELLAKKEFSVGRHAVAVVAEKADQPEKISPVFAASLHLWAGKQEIPLSALIGFHSLRFHVVSWDQIELSKGKFDWRNLDHMMTLARKSGYKDRNIMFNVCDTPKWAARRPDMEHNNNPGASPLYRGHAPYNIQDWKDFLTTIAKRYPGVKRYEVWNEPSFPGYSSFFYEPPEKLIPIDVEGYKALKAVDPQIEVILHGFEGEKYREYYKTILPMGVKGHFDTIALHQYNADIAPYRAIDRQLGLASKPWINTEWHAALYQPMARNIPSETNMPLRMVIGFLRQVQHGAKEVNLFSIMNLKNFERENLDFLRKHKYNFTHLGGLFRCRPYPQPRYMAAAWHVFTNSFSGKFSIGNGYDFGKWKVQTAVSGKGTVLIAWHEDKKALPLPGKISAAVKAGSSVLRPDGSPFAVAADKVSPGSYLLIRNADAGVVRTWKNKKFLLAYPKTAALPLNRDVVGRYRSGLLFDEKLNDKSPETFQWHETGKNVKAEVNAKSAPAKGKFAIGVTGKFLDLIAVVEDRKHVDHPNAENMEVWNSDSIQFAIDSRNKGIKNDRIEFAAARSRDGSANVWKVVAPSQKGEMYSGCSVPGNKVRFCKASVKRNNGKTEYRIRLAASELLPKVLKYEELRFCFLVNNNDGSGRAFYASWGDGIGDVKDPTLFGSLFAAPGNTVLPTTRNLRFKGWSRNYGLTLNNADTAQASVRVDIGDKKVAGVYSDPFEVTPGCRYRVSFRARGNTRLTFAIDPGRAGFGAMKRKDLMHPFPMKKEYRNFSFEFIPTEGQTKCGFVFFGWEQYNTWFEVTDFKVEVF